MFTLIAAVYFIRNRLAPFDPEGKLKGKDSHFIMQHLRQIDGLQTVDLSDTIIHFTSNDCSCTQFSEDHKMSIDKKAKIDGFKVININLSSDHPSFIPSTPSIAIINKSNKSLYFGPYSVGLACSESNGYVEVVLQNYAKGYSSNFVIRDVEGCYCHL